MSCWYAFNYVLGYGKIMTRWSEASRKDSSAFHSHIHADYGKEGNFGNVSLPIIITANYFLLPIIFAANNFRYQLFSLPILFTAILFYCQIANYSRCQLFSLPIIFVANHSWCQSSSLPIIFVANYFSIINMPKLTMSFFSALMIVAYDRQRGKEQVIRTMKQAQHHLPPRLLGTGRVGEGWVGLVKNFFCWTLSLVCEVTYFTPFFVRIVVCPWKYTFSIVIMHIITNIDMYVYVYTYVCMYIHIYGTYPGSEVSEGHSIFLGDRIQ